MWANIRSDLTEFVSSVTEEGANALAAIDSKLQDEETRRRLEQQDGNETSNPIMDEDGNVIHSEESFSPKAWDEILLIPVPSEEEIELDMESQSELISEVLIYNPDVAEALIKMVPSVMEECEFWKRYTYWCDKRIEDERSREEDVDTSMEGDDLGLKIEAGWKSLGNLVEGAVRAVAPMDAGMRPPFVMNTAVSDDDDDDDDEEEGLTNDDDDEQVEFSSSAADLSYKITLLEEERDILQQTVEMQRMEISKLMNKLEKSSCAKEEELQTALAETNVELVALKASINNEDGDSSKGDKIAEQAVMIHRLERTVKENEEQIETLKKQINDEGSNGDEIMDVKKQLEDSKLLNEQLTNEIKAFNISSTDSHSPEIEIQALKKEVAKLQAQLDDSEISSGEKIPEVKVRGKDDEDEDDWGEDWGDEE